MAVPSFRRGIGGDRSFFNRTERNMDIQVLKPPTLRIDDLLDVLIDPSSLLVKRPISIGTEHLDEVKFTALLIV